MLSFLYSTIHNLIPLFVNVYCYNLSKTCLLGGTRSLRAQVELGLIGLQDYGDRTDDGTPTTSIMTAVEATVATTH